MPTQEYLLTFITNFLPLVATVFIVVSGLWLAHVFLIKRQAELGNEKLFANQLVMLGLSLVGVLAVILVLPVSDSSRNQIIGLVGLVLSGIFAFSSSTMFANLLAGIMMRVTKPFRTGDFIQVGNYFGRVVERGLLDTEIQTEVRDLVALPNTYMVTNPITVTPSTGAIISTTLSLGYDVHNATISSLLTIAAENCGLTDPFVHIVELGDFSVVYKISGKLAEVKSLISSRTMLNREVLDVLHDNQIEITSPSFVNQRKLPDDAKMIPVKQQQTAPADTTQVDAVLFDKAEAAEQSEQQVEAVKSELAKLEEHLLTAQGDEKERLENTITKVKEQLKSTVNAKSTES